MIDTKRLHSMFVDSLYKEGEIIEGQMPEETVLVVGISANFGFHPQRLESHRQEVKDMLEQLPDDFKKSSGGGQSFLHMCEDKDGELWTGLHRTVEQLMCLAIGLKLASYCLPKDSWAALPGGMPYVTVNDGE